jgi:hypothetical protein
MKKVKIMSIVKQEKIYMSLNALHILKFSRFLDFILIRKQCKYMALVSITAVMIIFLEMLSLLSTQANIFVILSCMQI